MSIQDINPQVIAVSITAVTAIISPIITALINNKHQLRMKMLDTRSEKKMQAFYDFLEAFEQLQNPSFDTDYENKERMQKFRRFYTTAVCLSAFAESQELSNKLCELGFEAFRSSCIDAERMALFQESVSLIRNELYQVPAKYQSKQKPRHKSNKSVKSKQKHEN